ncbi:amidase [Paenibacillus forsythiae]|uniref:Amidase n=1 Tax=Paenibacillus forsythiae TaxID=365616 RepID=A0ABU3H8E3_9BACL|nr:amidase family protein [Paenibacillus forsythiae]MDT3427090.1 amidase [Paenibacillus forsythiae]
MAFDIVETTIPKIQSALSSGEITSRQLVLMYLERTAEHDRDGLMLGSVIEINPDALFIADAMDAERAMLGARGPLHGVPVMLKDNINTGDKMHTSAGSLALADSFAGEDAFIVSRLREAGAIILGKTNMTEFANCMTEGMPSGYSSRGGQTLNPYHISKPTGGSSSGSAVAVACNFCTVSVGTETSGSILSPASLGSVVGIKPTVGLLSRSGILPLSNSQDTAGPMARTVRDAVLLLNAMLGMDDTDAAMGASLGITHGDYTGFLDGSALQGARIGIPRDCYFEEVGDDLRALFEAAVRLMKDQGAVIIDPADVPTAREIRHSSVLLNEFKASLNAYLAKLGPGAPMRTLKDIIAFNHAHPMETLRYGQSLLLDAEYRTSGSLTEPQYLRDRAADIRLCKDEGIDAVMREHRLDALLFPADFGAAVMARAGYPSIVVPAGYTPDGEPFGVTFAGMAYAEPMLIRLAYAFEQHSKARRPPSLRSLI